MLLWIEFKDSEDNVEKNLGLMCLSLCRAIHVPHENILQIFAMHVFAALFIVRLSFLSGIFFTILLTLFTVLISLYSLVILFDSLASIYFHLGLVRLSARLSVLSARLSVLSASPGLLLDFFEFLVLCGGCLAQQLIFVTRVFELFAETVSFFHQDIDLLPEGQELVPLVEQLL